jgi:tripeptidyl-peptidase-1
LYKVAADSLTDIVDGKAFGCTQQIPNSGFSAVAGWDPVTGLGTPDFKKMRCASIEIEE